MEQYELLSQLRLGTNVILIQCLGKLFNVLCWRVLFADSKFGGTN